LARCLIPFVIARFIRAIHNPGAACDVAGASLLRLHRGQRVWRRTLHWYDQCRRAGEHRDELVAEFTKRYGVKRLVYFEEFATAADAIHREERIKKYPRAWELNLIARMNPDWRDLVETWNA
jgi:putative endonuclease